MVHEVAHDSQTVLAAEQSKPGGDVVHAAIIPLPVSPSRVIPDALPLPPAGR
jgi:hypothetical protein